MTIEVTTTTTCDVCGSQQTVEGAHSGVPAAGWAKADLLRRLDGEGWTNNNRLTETLCPKCTSKVAELLEEPDF